jgi:hypothetical protein
MAAFRKCAKWRGAHLRDIKGNNTRKTKYRRKVQNSCTVLWYSTSCSTTISEGWGRLNVWFQQFVPVVCTPAVSDAGEMLGKWVGGFEELKHVGLACLVCYPETFVATAVAKTRVCHSP